MNCSACQTTNPAGAKFCLNCGTKLALQCPSCGAEVPAGAKFCLNCGHKLAGEAEPAAPQTAQAASLEQFIPKELLNKLENARRSGGMEGERRIVTMLFCDVKGSTSAAEQLDPEEWAEIINETFEYMIAPIYRYEGTLARLMGDAILAFFGAPIAHEDDPQRAVLAGLEISQGVEQYKAKVKREWGLEIDVRVGINTGLVVVGAVGSDLRMEYTAMGDAINLAARMEQTAEPGTVQIAEPTYKQIAPLLDVQELGAVEVKGKSEPVKVYRVLGIKAEPGQLRGIAGLDSPVVGRDAEMATLRAAIAGLRQGRGQIISLIGDAGLGKSRLMTEVMGGPSPAANGRADIRWLEGRCLSYQTTTPYAPFVDLFAEHFEVFAEQSDAERYDRITAQIAAVSSQQVASIAPHIAAMMGVELTGSALERVKFLEPPVMRERTFGAVATYLEALSVESPVALIIDDLHWVDPTSLDLLEALLSLTDRTALLLLALFRPQRQEPSWRFHETAARDFAHRYQALHLKPLDADESRQLVANLLHVEDLPERVRSLILEKAEGNPFFVEEVIRSLLDSGLVIRVGGHWKATREIETIAVPDTLAAVINTRLDRLDEESRRAAQSAAVVGREFGYGILKAVHSSREPLDGPLTDLQRRELVREKTRLPERTYSFKHAVTQEAAYNSLLLKTRREMHLRVAGVLERTAPGHVNDIAHHYLAARAPARALPYLVEAADRAAQNYSTLEAIGAYEQALEIADPGADLVLLRRVYEGLGSALTFANRVPEAVEIYQAMLGLAEQQGDIPMQVSALNKISFVMALRMGQFEQAEEYLLESDARARAHEDKHGLSEMGLIRCMMCTAVADFDGVVRYLDETLALGRELGIDEQMTMALAHISASQVYMLQFDKAMKSYEEGLKLSREIGDRQHEAELIAATGALYYLCIGDVEQARALAEEAMHICLEIGDTTNILYAYRTLGLIAQYQGAYQEAISYYQRYLESSRSIQYPWSEAEALCLLGTSYLDISTELIDRVLGFHNKAVETLTQPAGDLMGGTAWAEIGYCLHAANKNEQAIEYFQKGLTHSTITGQLERPRLLVGASAVALTMGDVEGAARSLAEARSFADEHGLGFSYPLISCEEGRLAELRGDAEGAVEAYQRAGAEAGRMTMRPLVLRACAGAARGLDALGRTAEAGAKREEAHAVIDEVVRMFDDEELRETYLEHAHHLLDGVPVA